MRERYKVKYVSSDSGNPRYLASQLELERSHMELREIGLLLNYSEDLEIYTFCTRKLRGSGVNVNTIRTGSSLNNHVSSLELVASELKTLKKMAKELNLPVDKFN